jgi:DNA-directed RNA polymerase specialized sigma24 family protein
VSIFAGSRSSPLHVRSFWACIRRKKRSRYWLVNAEVEPRAFTTTRWSLVLAGTNADGDQQKAAQALAELCRTYWRPIFSYVCRRGYSNEDAQDIAQDFFLMVLKTNWLQQADQNRGRFRSLLLKSLQNFLHNLTDTKQTLKRGGGVEFVSWDAWMAEAPSQLSFSSRALDSLAPERLFDLRWAATVVDHALRRLREECEGKGRLRLFEGLRDYLAAEHADISYANLGASLGVADTVVKKQLHNLRQRYRWLLRDEVAHTVANPSDVDDEIRHLCATLAAAA